MPRDKGGIGRTGRKHKKKAVFDVRRQPKLERMKELPPATPPPAPEALPAAPAKEEEPPSEQPIPQELCLDEDPDLFLPRSRSGFDVSMEYMLSKRIADAWRPKSHRERELLARQIIIGHEENAEVCTCEHGSRAVGTPSWLCRERRCYAYEIGMCEEEGCQYPGEAGCFCMVNAWDRYPRWDPAGMGCLGDDPDGPWGVPWYRKTKSQRIACWRSEEPRFPPNASHDDWPWSTDFRGGIMESSRRPTEPPDLTGARGIPHRMRGFDHGLSITELTREERQYFY